MRNNLYTLILILFVGFNSSAQSFKSLYYESLNYLEVYDFESALPILEKMYQLQQPFHF